MSPTIKGIFVMSHVKALEKERGLVARQELEKRYGSPIAFRNTEDVPIREEVKIIEHALDLSAPPVPPERRSIEAGRLHFRNFSGTPLGKLVLPFFKDKLKLVLMNASNVAGHVFQGVSFRSEDLGPRSVRITMENNDYPLGHFQGFFEEWIDYSGNTGTVEATDAGGNVYSYTLSWHNR